MDLKQLEVKKDSRGSLIEAYKLPNDGQVFYVIANPNETRGNHFHERKTERFLVIYGSAVIESKDRNTGNIMKVEVSGYKPVAVTIPPNNTHRITATDEGAIFMVWVDEVFNKDDPDTIGEEI